jgi:hypothetical protein
MKGEGMMKKRETGGPGYGGENHTGSRKVSSDLMAWNKPRIDWVKSSMTGGKPSTTLPELTLPGGTQYGS